MTKDRVAWIVAAVAAVALHAAVLVTFTAMPDSALDGGAGQPEAVAGIAEADFFQMMSDVSANDAESPSDVADTGEPLDPVEETEVVEAVAPETLEEVAPEEVPEPQDEEPAEPPAPDEAEQVPPEQAVPSEPEEVAEALPAEEVEPVEEVLQPVEEVTEMAALSPEPDVAMPQARPDSVPQEVLEVYRAEKQAEREAAERRERERAEAAARRRAEAQEAARRDAASRRPAPSAGARAGGGGSQAQGPSRRAVATYNSRIYAHLARYKRYPSGGRSNGTVTVRFTISASGAAGGVRLTGSSGDAALDQAAVAMVNRASPFPRIPPEFGRSSMTFTVPVSYTRR
ncbi:TonB family protein [Afifella sp. H1R]|uniref:energy transducer TonB family protein n=1 Tax=Afifella sp. H1R TaxID=2908841 RepID=UPI001F433E25|nr:TonB family protein [Afifella sp. H1R]